MYKCPNCGGDLRFSPEKQKLVCDYCRSEFAPKEIRDLHQIEAGEGTEQAGEEPTDRYFQTTVFTCPMCGAELLSADDTAATFCSYCGSSVLLKSRVSNALKPDEIIPFRISQSECASIYRRMMKKRLFAPSDMTRDAQIEKFRSIYMPYWIYDYHYDDKLRIRGRKERRRGSYIHTRHFRLNTDVKLSYSGISCDASSSFADRLSRAVSPFDRREAVGFDSAYISGHYADIGDVTAAVYEPDARAAVKMDAASRICKKDRVYRRYRVSAEDISGKLNLKEERASLGFFPVWFLACQTEKGDRVCYAVINGQTGKAAADVPVSIRKYLAGSILLALPVFILFSFVLNLTLTPRLLLALSMLLGLIGTVIANRQLNQVYTRENNLDDKGWMALNRPISQAKTIKTKRGRIRISARESVSTTGQIWTAYIVLMVLSSLGLGFLTFPLMVVAVLSLTTRGLLRDNGILRKKKNENYPAPFRDKLPTLVKPLFGIVVSLMIMILNPVSDLIPYTAALASLLLIVWCFLDIINLHNRLTTRKLPQLGRRGGDENA